MDLPTTLSARYVIPEPNSAVELYRGPATISDGLAIPCVVVLEWLPGPTIRFRLEDGHQFQVGEKASFAIEGHPVSGLVFSQEGTLGTGRRQHITAGIINRIELGAGESLHAMTFEVANLNHFMGDPTLTPRGGVSRNRVVLEAVGWRITIDGVPGLLRLEDRLSSTGGYALTHTGRAERLRNAPFHAASARGLIQGLHFFLSFVQGARTGPILPRGLGRSGNEVWRLWASPRVSPFKVTDGWFSYREAAHLPQLFEGFSRRWANPRKRPSLKAAVHWYVEANRQSGGLEGALILAQAALELMSSLSAVTARGSRASDRIRALLDWIGVSSDLPSSLKALDEGRSVWGYENGPHAITRLRNGLTHASGYQRLEMSPHHLVYEARTLALWYLELALLRWFEYSGPYGNRLLGQRGEWETEPVPWSV